ncbi:uncharacterized protein LOC121794439 isoform X1 [Salvia splendens]|uniref:uncharacterized protein LOC121794439 isoform X1 n=1 Tax=Salvia splendens TaxID=180675 RepID=UPI001C2645F0|nr:uncharacterized protein LOC121794439 isoform X1 [Salvia splendens]XP_042048534.1 uncharacterized protein LOC121794439 isoform X1 [Salvia splendens]
MGFNKVYKSLQEIFPQIDARALRAVAIEHSKDADAAVEAVLVEIIPFFSERSRPHTPSTGSTTVGESSGGAVTTVQTADCTSVNAVAGSTDAQSSYVANFGYQKSFSDVNDGHTEPLSDTNVEHHEREGVMAYLNLSGSVHDNNMQLKTDIYSHDEVAHLTSKDGADTLQIEVSVEPKTDKTASNSSIQLASDDACHTMWTLQGKDSGSIQDLNMLSEGSDSRCLETEFDTATNDVCEQGKSYGDDRTCVVGPASFIVRDLTASLPENNFPLLALREKSVNDSGELDVSLPCNSAPKMEAGSNIIDSDDESTLSGSMSQSSKIHMIDALANIIADARNNKKMLFSAMDSAISLMREVELKEKAAEQAREEAAMGGTDILVKSEELKHMVKLAEETNSMQAGEVYGEKAILATELRELQSRALSLSVERDKYLAVLNAMQQTLEVRLTEAQNVIKSAELEKTEKENAAMKALTEQELIMEKVLQESKILNQQAEDNSKLREFLVDRGRAVDTLQGEISVICQDVRMLKETFDEDIPFSKSLSSSQTSCILASSASSSKSLIREQVDLLPDEGTDSLDTRDKKGTVSCSTESSSQDEAAGNDDKALSDDEWEMLLA